MSHILLWFFCGGFVLAIWLAFALCAIAAQCDDEEGAR